ncbi:MAG: aminotransferase class V-fold PLP-dependent enzyme [Salinivirgaceae bacterium]|jgi:selenocysteine lyase/cysteine desulfurase|nr:aminotransferase class V-fold PLP-dependent enzyme [Salinivirgaceae bacterium]
MSELESYFQEFRKGVVGDNATYMSPYGEKKIFYADWVASGRLHKQVEYQITNVFGPFVANTHTESSETGTRMTQAYHYAQSVIKKHVNAGPDDVIIAAGFGMTAVVNKLIRIMGLRSCKTCLKDGEKPVVFITHMEHHSNHTSWLETNAEVVIVPPGEGLTVDPNELRILMEQFKDRKYKIGAFTACSNVTGVHTPYYELAKVMHEYNGLVFIDYAASAPYEEIDMHPGDEMAKLDGIYFSPHKFMGGPGSSGILLFDSKIYNNEIPDNPGGGTVDWTNPWNEYKYVESIEAREDGGTPGFLQLIKVALAFELKAKMGIDNIVKREKELIQIAFSALKDIPSVHILAENIIDRLGILSFYIVDIHFNMVVKLLSDRFGIQVRGGCACAGTYGHYLLEVSHEKSHEITNKINHGDLSEKPGWIRWSLHPTTTNKEVYYFVDAVKQIVENIKEWEKDYNYDNKKNEFFHKKASTDTFQEVKEWFKI